jgi:AraC-like DNA-binding protein
MEALDRTIPNRVSWIITLFTRGSTQIVQPAKTSGSLLKAYTNDHNIEDAATWQAIRQNKVLTESDIWDGFSGGFEGSGYYREFMEPAGLRYLAVAPLASPVLAGHPGAWHVYRSAEQGAFSAGELQQLGRLARQYDQAVETARQGRQGKGASPFPWIHKPPVRIVVFDGQLQPIYNDSGLNVYDARIRDQISRHARQTLTRLEGGEPTNDRLVLPDSRGDLWVFHVVGYPKYPALGSGPFIWYLLQPDCKEWGVLRPADLQADSELSRLVPAMQYMHKEFGHGVTLNDIAATVKLSPFHFHRRFTELFGITPKHFLLECQIYAAKSHMVAGEKDLVEIANACGFAHQSHFTSRFKQATGLTPTGWRKVADELQSGR